jgi:hypothetical protein
MSEKPLPFVITDRRKFNAEGESRPDADPSPAREPRPETLIPEPAAGAPSQSASPVEAGSQKPGPKPVPEATAAEPEFPPAPTEEQMEQSRLAYEATAERIDTAVRAANPGAEHPPAMTLDQLIQSVYMQCIMQLGGGTPEGQQPQVDILGARSSIDLLGVLAEKTKGNLTATEELMLSSAIFELRLAFLDITQALARSAQQRAAATPPPPGGGPRIVR